MPTPLEGIRVVDWTIWQQGPVASAMLADLGADDLRLFETLREIRKQLAVAQGVPSYVIFGDATLLEMSRVRPSNSVEFLDINGVGQVKLERYGDSFLDVLRGH